MRFLRKAALASAATLLSITLFALGLVWSVHLVFHTPDNIKSALKDSGMYSAAVPELLKERADAQTVPGGDDIPITRPEVRTIINNAFPPEFLQTQTEQVLDDVYAWLDGEKAQLQFTVRLADAKNNLATGLEQYVLQRLNSLPVCTAADLSAGNSGDIDAFNAPCIPAGTDKAAVAAKARQQITQGEFLKDTTLDASTIKTDDGTPLDQQLKGVPTAHSASDWALWGGMLLALALAAAIVFLSATWRGGVRKVAIMAIVIGTFSTLLGWLSNFAVDKYVRNDSTALVGDTPLQKQFIDVLSSLASNLCTTWIVYGVVLAVLGIGALVALHLTRPKNAIDLRTPPTKEPIKKGEEPDDLPTKDGTVSRHEHVVQPPHHNETTNPQKR